MPPSVHKCHGCCCCCVQGCAQCSTSHRLRVLRVAPLPLSVCQVLCSCFVSACDAHAFLVKQHPCFVSACDAYAFLVKQHPCFVAHGSHTLCQLVIPTFRLISHPYFVSSSYDDTHTWVIKCRPWLASSYNAQSWCPQGMLMARVIIQRPHSVSSFSARALCHP